MFEQAFVECQAGTKRPWTVAASFGGQMLFVALMALLPLAQTGVITPARLAAIMIARPPGPAPRVLESHPSAAAAHANTPALRRVANGFQQPARIPDRILIDDGAPQPALAFDSAGPGFPVGDAVFNAPQVSAPPAQPPVPAPAKAPVRLRIGGDLQAGKILRQVTPVYPAIAKQARISGQVRLEAIIAKNGRIENLQVISGHPLLVQAAIEAVRQWVYRPTLLNGEPVEVMTVIDVNFGLR